MVNCPDCGTTLKLVDGRWFCPNHGFVFNDQEEDKEEFKERSYLG